MEIRDSVALITGANRGLGRALAQALLAAGAARVYAGARNPAKIDEGDARLVPIKLDVTDSESIARAAGECSDISLLVNNAGIMEPGPLLGAQAETALRQELDVNVLGMLRMVQAFTPILARNAGAIINVLSIASWRVNPLFATYSISKHAAHALTEGLRVQLRSQGVKVFGVYAGFIDTDTATAFQGTKSTPHTVAGQILQGLRDEREHIHADQRSKDVWQALLADPDALQARMQQLWDETLAHAGKR